MPKVAARVSELIDGLASIPWEGRPVCIVYDSDASTNKNVLSAEWLLAQALKSKGAVVKVVRLPPGPPDADGNPAKVGLDDFLVANPPEALDRADPGRCRPEAAGQGS